MLHDFVIRALRYVIREGKPVSTDPTAEINAQFVGVVFDHSLKVGLNVGPLPARLKDGQHVKIILDDAFLPFDPTNSGLDFRKLIKQLYFSSKFHNCGYLSLE